MLENYRSLNKTCQECEIVSAIFFREIDSKS